MNVLILSIHIKHDQSTHWQRLQPQFVAETAGDYEYGVIVNGDDPGLYKNVVHHLPHKVPHRQGIAAAMRLFRANRRRFSHFLLLDSDCFPVRPDWMKILGQLLGSQYQYAAPMRVENFDLFPHPCAFFMTSGFLDQANFNFERANNLLGVEVSDVGAAMPQYVRDRQIWYPLLKTNYISPHPVYASIYGDLFYHHCAGSRGLGFRANSYNFYNHVLDRPAHRQIYQRVTSQLVSRPRQFIDALRGVRTRTQNRAADL